MIHPPVKTSGLLAAKFYEAILFGDEKFPLLFLKCIQL